jgi:hypothetical protein
MRSRILAVLALASLCAAAPPAPPKPKTIAPESLPHSVAMFLSTMCADGRQRVAFKASAFGTYFFFEEATGVSVYTFDGVGYRRQAFLKGLTLAQAMQKYRSAPGKRPAPPKTKP